MRVEVLAVGTELLLGQIVDTNSAWMGQRLADSGIDCLYQAKVGDNRARVVEALADALERADAVICCGGLGPTQDDLTRDAIAEVMGVPLVRDEAIGERISAMFASRGRKMPENNLRQAEVPEGAIPIEQRRGTAPGLICPVGDKVVYAVPGVPHEMREMIERAVVPDLESRQGSVSLIASRTLRTWGLAESALAEQLAPLIDELDTSAGRHGASGTSAGRHGDSGTSAGLTVAFLASGIEGIKVRLTTKVVLPAGSERAAAEERAKVILDSGEARVRELLGEVVFGVDSDNMEATVGQVLAGAGRTLGVAESLTGGLVGARLSAVPGASAWFRGSVVAYSSEVKRRLLGVDDGPVVTEEAAVAMAEGALRQLGCDVALALTGVAGPSEQEGQPVGTVWVAVAGIGPVARSADGVLAGGSGGGGSAGGGSAGGSAPAPATRLLRLPPSDRDQVRQLATISGLDLVRRRLLGL